MKERIQKLLGNAGIASRRSIEDMVRQGRIKVNGKVMTELPILVDPAKDRIVADGEVVHFSGPKAQRRYYFIMNKPKGVYSTNVAQGEQLRAIDLLPPDLDARLYPVGRLDAESTGLLLLTNDGELTNQLTHPRYGVAQTYHAIVDGEITGEAIRPLKEGVWLGDKEGRGIKTGRSQVRIVHRGPHRSVLEITIREGRNREVRRLLAAAGHKVRELTRTRMGPLTLHKLGMGQFRALTEREVRELKRSVKQQEPR